MASKRKNVIRRKERVKGAIKNGLLQGNARLEFLQQPAAKKQMRDFLKKHSSALIKQKI